MDLEDRLRASLVAPDPGPAFTARVMARLHRGGGRRGSRFIVVSGLLAIAAAAGMLAWQHLLPRQPNADVNALSVAGGLADPNVQPPAATGPVPERQAASATAEAALPEQLPTQFSVLVLPLRQAVQDASLHRRIEAFQSALLEELPKIPGLALRVSHQLVPGPGEAPDFVLSLTSLATGTAPSGGVTVLPTDGGNSFTVTGSVAGAGMRNERAASTADSAAHGASAVTGLVTLAVTNRLAGFNVDYGIGDLAAGGGAGFLFSGELGSVTGISGSGGIIDISDVMRGDPGSVSWVEVLVVPRQSAASRYTLPVNEDDSPAQLAAALVGKLRLQVLPPDAGYQQRVLARLANARTSGSVLQDLLPLLAVDGGERLEPATVQAVFQFVANHPAEMRAKVWQTLNRTDNPLLVAPLLDSLRQDPDQRVRLAALANLEIHHARNAAVRSALEALEPAEADPFVRAAVRWILHGENQWRADVVSALQDDGLSYEARLAPLVARTPADQLPQQSWQRRRSLMEQEQVFGPLLALVRENLRDPGLGSVTSEALRLIGNIEHPAVTDLFLPLLEDTSLPIEVRGAVTTWALNHQNDPGVKEAMPQVFQGVPSALRERMNEIAGPGAGVVEMVPAR